MDRTTKTIAKSTKHTGRPFREKKKTNNPRTPPMTLPLEDPRSDDRLYDDDSADWYPGDI